MREIHAQAWGVRSVFRWRSGEAASAWWRKALQRESVLREGRCSVVAGMWVAHVMAGRGSGGRA
jgi:hypothetical protein